MSTIVTYIPCDSLGGREVEREFTRPADALKFADDISGLSLCEPIVTDADGEEVTWHSTTS